MGLDRSLDAEGIPDLEGPLPGKAATGDPQEGAPPPSERPAAGDYGMTAAEQSRPEALDARLGRELPDTVIADDEPAVIVAPEDEDLLLADDEQDAVGRVVDEGLGGLSAEEAAVHVVDEP